MIAQETLVLHFHEFLEGTRLAETAGPLGDLEVLIGFDGDLGDSEGTELDGLCCRTIDVVDVERQQPRARRCPVLFEELVAGPAATTPQDDSFGKLRQFLRDNLLTFEFIAATCAAEGISQNASPSRSTSSASQPSHQNRRQHFS